MPDYGIRVVVDPSQATQGAKVVQGALNSTKATASGLQTAIQRAFDFEAGPAVQASSAVDAALEGVEASANAADQAIQKVNGSIGILAATSVKSANDMRSINADLAKTYGLVGSRVNDVNNTIVKGSKQAQQGTLILGEQFRQFATEVQTGISPVQAFAQQAGQAAFALQFMGGTAGKVGTFLAGPFGTLAIVATTVLAGLAEEFLHNKKAAEDAEKALEKFEQRQENIANFIDITTGKIKEQNKALIANAAALRRRDLAEGESAAKKSTASAFATASAGAVTGEQFSAERQPGFKSFDPQVARVIEQAGGDVQKLVSGLDQLAKRSPQYRKVADDTALAASAALSYADTEKKLNKEIEELNGKTDAQAHLTTSAIERQVALSTATTGLERAQARLNDVKARAAAIDKEDDSPQKRAELAQYKTDLTAATVAVHEASEAQKEARKSTAEHNAELRKQRELAERVADFLAKIKDTGDALSRRGVDATIATQVDAFTRQFNRAPSADERKQIEDGERRNQLLTDEKSVLDNLRGPVETYQRQLAALTDLLARGKISQDEFNKSITELPLNQALAAVDKTLTGTLTEYQAQLDAIDAAAKKALSTIDDAEKAGIINPKQANQRRADVQSTQDRSQADLDRARRQPVNDLDKALGGKLGQNNEIEEVTKQEQERLRIIQDARNQELITQQEFEDRRVAIHADAKKQLDDIDAARKKTALDAASDTFGSLADITATLIGKNNAVYKTLFIAQKAFAIASAIVSIQQGIAAASALPFPLNLGAIASVAAATAGIVANIASVGLALKDGGYVSGRGTSTSDSIPARLSDGEFVVNAQATRSNRALLEAINSGRSVRTTRTAANDGGSNGRPLNLRIDSSNVPGVDFDVHQLTHDDVEVIAKRVVTKEAGKVVSTQLADANSRVSKTLQRTTTTSRRRT
jgi:hypothetical protein